MNKKGFTLIELLAVVTIIALISIIAIPNITKNVKDKKNEISEANQKLLAAATDTYIENNKSRYEYSYEANGSTYCIPIQTLIDNGVLEKPFKNVNGQEIDYSNQVQATYLAEYNSFDYKIVENCTEIKQYVSRPNLAENMIPVKYDETLNAWVKVDKNSHWYNYSEKKWANAVLVREFKSTEPNSKSRYEYEEASIGTPILESDILAQFVWIPRFKYQVFESNTKIPINIVFEKQSEPKSTGTTTGQWLTHPAFTYNNQELSGIWVGKYETSNQDDNIIIKSNQTQLTNVNYVEANKKAIQMTNKDNVYGLKEVNTHMTRNSEWGASVYLTNSIYGNQNNNSSTGNITGIYNLSGNKEFVILDNQDENSLGYALSETKNWATNNTYTTNENTYLTRGNNSIFSYNDSKVIDENTTFRISLTNFESQKQEKYIVTLEPNGGTISETTKEVSYHETYGQLPTPTKSGYVFKGWSGKNLLDMDNFIDTFSKYQRRKTEKTTFDGYDVYKIFGYLSQAGRNNHYMEGRFKENTQYTISLDIYDVKANSNVGFIVKVNYTDGTNEQAIPQTRVEGQWQSLSFTSAADKTISYINFTYGTAWAYSYIKNFQIEEGTQKTSYEPYKLYTKDTVVQKDNVHTLYAIWGQLPQLALTKETYKNIDFTNWTLSSNSSVSNGELTIGSDGAAADATSDYIDVNNDFWYMTFDAYSTVAGGGNTYNSTNWTTIYYNSSKESAAALTTNTNNGYAAPVLLNEWNNNIYWYSMDEWPGANRYGSNVKYIKIKYVTNTSSYKAPMKIKNLKVYGQMINSFYLINLDITNNESIVIRKYAQGSQNANYFKTGGTSFTGNQITVTSNGTYTVYIEDVMGNYSLQTIEITNIG